MAGEDAAAAQGAEVARMRASVALGFAEAYVNARGEVETEAGAVAADWHDPASCRICQRLSALRWRGVCGDVDGLRGEGARGRDRGGADAGAWAMELGRRRFALEYPAGLGGPSEWASPGRLVDNLARHVAAR